MKTPPLLALAASIAYAGAAHAQASSSARAEDLHLFNPRVVPFEAYEPSYIGYTRDSDDVGFMDFKISVKYPVFREAVCMASKHARLYFIFTGRWGQYIATRDSSPVIAKRFNPKMAWRQVLNYVDDPSPVDVPTPTADTRCYQEPRKLAGTYFEIAFGHESNGQTISTREQLTEAEDRARDVGDRPSFAKDHISRGWDVVEMTWRHPWHGEHHVTNVYAIAKYFLRHGPFQGNKEEFNPLWETDPEGKPRSYVNGLGAIVKWQGAWQWEWFGKPKVAAVFETGYSRPFRYNTVRVEGGVRFLDLPITLWAQSGYGSDLAQYYKRVKSRGVELEIGSF